MTAGIDRRTGRPLAGWPHVVQSLGVILSTGIGSRILRRDFGFAGLGLLGRENMHPSAVLRFVAALAIAIELWEPRFRIRAIRFPATRNSPDALRQGRVGLELLGDYRPRALEGDFTVASTEVVNL